MPSHLRLVLGALCLSLLAFSTGAKAGGDYAQCDTNMCYTHQQESIRQRVLKGETVVLTQTDPASPFELTYVLKRINGVDPKLLAGLFTSVEELPAHIQAITEAQVLSHSGNSTVVRYELDVKRLASDGQLGGLASKAPVSRYAVTTHLEKQGEGYLVWWELEPSETARLNPKKGLFNTANLGEPGHVHGYLMAEPIAGTADSVVTYANYVVPKSGLAKTMAGTMNSAARVILSSMVASITQWAQTVVAQGAGAQKYRDRCETLLTSR